jgi:hypothetical protein
MLSREYSANLIVLYSFRLIRQSEEEEMVDEKKIIEKKANDQFLELEKDMLSSSGISYEFKTEVGFTLDRIKSHLKKNGIRFLIVDKSEGINKEIFEGISNFEVPVLLI